MSLVEPFSSTKNMKVLHSFLLIVASSLLAVNAFPRKEHVHKTIDHARHALRKQVNNIVHWLEHDSEDSGEIKGCSHEYQRKVDSIFNETTRDIDSCLLEGENTFLEIESYMRLNRIKILNEEANLQQSLERCAGLNSTDFFECYVETVSTLFI